MDIIRATKKGSYKSVKKILEEDPRKIDTVDRHGYTALMISSEDGNQRIVNLLLSRGANPRIKSKDSDTALSLASYSGHVSIIKELLDGGARIDSKDSDGDSPLIIASNNGHLKAVKLLLKEGANPLLKNSDSKTAFDVTDSDSIKKLLAQAIGAKPLIAMLSKNKRSKYIQLPKDIVRELHKYL